jgi:hypothetical protein
MYSIYHIPGIKIGCSVNPKRRVKEQGYTEYEILEKYTDIHIASKREIELRNQYGYKEDNVKTNYVQHYEFGKIGRNNMTPGKGAKTQIKNKIGIFAYSKEERQKLNASIAHTGGNVTKEKYSKPIDMFDYKTGKFIKSFTSASAALKESKICNIKSVLNGLRKHSKGYTFKYKQL